MERVYIVKNLKNDNYHQDGQPIYITEDLSITTDINLAHKFSLPIASRLLNQIDFGIKTLGPYWILESVDKYIPQPGDIFKELGNQETEDLKFVYIDTGYCWSTEPECIYSGLDQNGTTWSFFKDDKVEKIGSLNNVI